MSLEPLYDLLCTRPELVPDEYRARFEGLQARLSRVSRFELLNYEPPINVIAVILCEHPDRNVAALAVETCASDVYMAVDAMWTLSKYSGRTAISEALGVPVGPTWYATVRASVYRYGMRCTVLRVLAAERELAAADK